MLIPVLCVLLAAGTDDLIRFTPVEKGAGEQLGNNGRQLQAQLVAEKPAAITKVPDGLTAPLYAKLPITGEGGKAFHVIIDEPEGQPSKLFVDSNGDGDLTNDSAPEWEARKAPDAATNPKAFTTYAGGASVQIGTAESPFNAHVSMFRADKNDPRRAAFKSVVVLFCDYALRGDVTLGGKAYKAMVADVAATGDFRGDAAAKEDADSGVMLLLDVNGNGTFDKRGESYDVRKPFKIGGVAYEIADMSRDGRSFRVAKSDKQVEEILPPPEHKVGKKITAFEAKLMDGKTVKFPADYKGKVVLLDFWATWCGPCMMEVPNVVAAYDKFHEKGFEVLAVSLDQANSEEKIKQVLTSRKMPWPQVYDGKGWAAEVAQKYAIESIPATFVVDGDSGEILAVGARGPKLADVVEKALAKKAGK